MLQRSPLTRRITQVWFLLVTFILSTHALAEENTTPPREPSQKRAVEPARAPNPRKRRLRTPQAPPARPRPSANPLENEKTGIHIVAPGTNLRVSVPEKE